MVIYRNAISSVFNTITNLKVICRGIFMTSNFQTLLVFTPKLIGTRMVTHDNALKKIMGVRKMVSLADRISEIELIRNENGHVLEPAFGLLYSKF